MVRAFEPIMDAVPLYHLNTTPDRHVAQRNIAVVYEAPSAAELDVSLDLGYPNAPSDAEVDMRLDPPRSMQWLKVLTGRADPG